jgi:hypothetical protein
LSHPSFYVKPIFKLFLGSRPRFARFTPDVRLFFRTGRAISFILQTSASHLVSALFHLRPTRKPCNVLTFFAISYFPFVDRLAIAPEKIAWRSHT